MVPNVLPSCFAADPPRGRVWILVPPAHQLLRGFTLAQEGVGLRGLDLGLTQLVSENGVDGLFGDDDGFIDVEVAFEDVG